MASARNLAWGMGCGIALAAGVVALGRYLAPGSPPPRPIAVTVRESGGTEQEPPNEEVRRQAVTARLQALFDRPDSPLRVQPVSLEGKYAVAGWVQGRMGGRAFLEEREGQWEIVACAGDGLLQPNTYVLAGMSPDSARRLVTRVQHAEAALPLETRHQFSLFSGSMDPAAHEGHRHSGTHSAKAAPAAR